MGGPQLSTSKVLVGPLVDPGMAVQLSQLDHQQGPPRPAVDYWVIFMGSMVSEKSVYLWIYGYLFSKLRDIYGIYGFMDIYGIYVFGIF